ncbi:MAG: LytTR family transcriptional regulator [Clostridia bacterium]|nr:LytTR family transcriptional regulator [Clostridia bacterium]
MKIEFLQDSEQLEPKIVVVAMKKNDEVSRVCEQLERMYAKTVNGYAQDRVQMLAQSDIIRIYAEDAHVYCQTADGIWQLHARLYEMEERLDAQMFVRISKCELVNKNKILHLDVSFTGTVGVVLEGNIRTYTSRRYVHRIKQIFGL